MNTRKLLTALMTTALLLVTGLPAMAQDKEEKGDPGMEAMMAEFAKYSIPGDHHKPLTAMVGTWDVVGKFWMGPGEPMEATGVATFRSEFGGLYVFQEYSSEMFGKPFHGLGISGYDIFNGKHVEVWMDDMSSTLHHSEGTCTKDHKTITTTGMMDDPMTGEKGKKVKSVTEFVDDDKFVYSMYDVVDDGPDVKTMELTYTRRK